MPKDGYIIANNSFADIAKSITPSNLLDENNIVTRRSVIKNDRAISHEGYSPSPGSVIFKKRKVQKDKSPLKLNPMVSELQPLSSEYQNPNLLPQKQKFSLLNIPVTNNKQDSSAHHNSNFSFQIGKKQSVLNEDNENIPLATFGQQ